MKHRKSIYYTPEQKTIICDRYKPGDSLHDIARMLDRYHSSVMPTIVFEIARSPEKQMSCRLFARS